MELDRHKLGTVPVLPGAEAGWVSNLVAGANRQRDVAWHLEQRAIAQIEALVG